MASPSFANSRRRLVLSVVFMLGVVSSSVWLATRPPASSQTASSPLVSHPAPFLEGRTLQGYFQRLTQLRGSFVLVNFFASWCVACGKEEPQLKLFEQSGMGKVLSVDFQDDNAFGRAFLVRYRANWPAIIDRQGQAAVRWGVAGPPESFFISRSGVVLSKIVGPVNFSELSSLVVLARSKGY